MEINRRKFISTLFLSTLSLPFLSNTLTDIFISEKFSSPLDIPRKLKEASILRKKGKWKSAKKIYTQILLAKPSEIRAYDGIKRIILSLDNNNLTDVLQLYLSGLKLNPGQASFYERLASVYSCIAQGNKKLSEKLGSPSELYTLAMNYIEKASELDPQNPVIYSIYNKLKKRKDLKVDIIDSRDNKNLKLLKKSNEIELKNALLKKDALELEKNISVLVKKESSPQRTIKSTILKTAQSKRIKQISKLYVASINQLKKDGNISEAIKKSQELYNFTQGSDNALSIVKKLCFQFHKPEEFIDISRSNHQKKNTFWSGIGLIDCLISQFKHEQIYNLSEAQNHLNTLILKRDLPIHFFEWEYRNVLLSIYSKETEAYNKLMNLGNSLIGISSAHIINRFTKLCVIYFLYRNQKENAIQIIDIALKNNSLEIAPNSIYEKVNLVSKNKNTDKEIHKKQLLDLRNNIIQSL